MFIFVVYDVYVMLLASTDNLQCVCVLVACSVQEPRRMPGQGFLAWQSMTSATGNGVKRTGKDWQTACKHPFAIVSICYCKFCCNPYTHAIQKQVEIRQSQSFILAVYDRLSPKYLLPAMNPNHGERGNSRYNQRAFCCRHLLAHCSWAHTFFECPSISFHPSNELSSCIQSSQCSRTAGDGQSEWKDQSIHGWTQGLNELSCLQLQWNLPPMAVMNTYEHQKLWEQSRGHWDVMMFHKDSDCDSVILCQGAMVETVGGQTTGHLQLSLEDDLKELPSELMFFRLVVSAVILMFIFIMCILYI